MDSLCNTNVIVRSRTSNAFQNLFSYIEKSSRKHSVEAYLREKQVIHWARSVSDTELLHVGKPITFFKHVLNQLDGRESRGKVTGFGIKRLKVILTHYRIIFHSFYQSFGFSSDGVDPEYEKLCRHLLNSLSTGLVCGRFGQGHRYNMSETIFAFSQLNPSDLKTDIQFIC